MKPRRSTFVALLWVGLVLASPVLADSGWAGFRGPVGTGQAADLPPGQGPLSLRVAWKRPLGSAYSGISIAEDTLVTAGSYGDRDYVLALDPKTGEERWRYDLAPAHRGHDGSHDGPISTPAIADGRVFTLSPAGQLAAIDLETGEGLWRVHLVHDLGCERPFYDFGSSPLVVGETVVLQVGCKAGSVAGFAVATGEVLWQALDDTVCTQSPIRAELAGEPQVLVLGTRLVAGLDPADGTVLWSVEHEGGPGISLFASPLPLDGDRVLVQHSRDATAIVEVASEGGELSASILRTSRGLTKTYSPATRAGRYVYGYTGRFLTSVDPASGEMLWRSREPGDGFLIAIGDRLAVLSKTGSLHLGAASAEAWQESQRLDLFEDLAWTPPSYAAGAIYARSLGEIARVDLVRAPGLTAQSVAPELPTALAALAGRVEEADDPEAAVDVFLQGRELPLVAGDEVVFLWRGEAEDLAIAGDMIGMRREEPMHRLPGTDLWWWATRLDRRARVSYLFYVDDAPTVDPAHSRTAETVVLGIDRNWNRTGEPVRMSWMAMPDWPGLAAARVVSSTDETTAELRGRIDVLELTVQPPTPEGEEPLEPVEVSLDVWLPPGYDQATTRYPVVYPYGSSALEEGGWSETLDRVVGRSVVPLIVVFVDLPRMPNAETVFAEQVVPAVDEHYRTLADRDHRALAGVGWGSLDATFDLFARPDLFGALGVQSFFCLEEPMAELLEVLGDQDASTVPLRIYFEWGRWDLISPHENMNMRFWGREGWNLLRARGWEPMGGEVWDSTDWPSWRNRVGLLLESLFPAEGFVPDLSAWQTGSS